MAKKKPSAAALPPQQVPQPDPFTLPPTNWELIMGERIDDLTRITVWDDARFERYVHEWAFTLQKKGTYGKVVWASGAGDKGRDVRAYVTDETGEWDNFQCKFYDHKLAPSDVWLELAKLCYYTQKGDFTVPRKYYFVAPQDLGPDLSTLIGNGPEIRKQLLKAWEKTGNGTIDAKLVPLDTTLRAYVDAFDFSRITFKPQREILDDLKDTEYHKRVFGCGGLKRPKPEPIPPAPTKDETNYVLALLAAFAEHLQIDITALSDDILKKREDLDTYLKAARTCFYRAEQLHRFGRDTFPSSHCFEELQDQVYMGVLGVAMGEHADGFAKVRAVVTKSGEINLGGHFLVGLNLVEVHDRHGICHQIANLKDGRLVWVVKAQEKSSA